MNVQDDDALGAGHGVLQARGQRSSFVFTRGWRRQPWPPPCTPRPADHRAPNAAARDRPGGVVAMTRGESPSRLYDGSWAGRSQACAAADWPPDLALSNRFSQFEQMAVAGRPVAVAQLSERNDGSSADFGRSLPHR